jgi:hypothetical protein
LQRRAISTEFSSACGRSANSSPSRPALEVLLGRKQLRPALIGEHVALRDAHARLVRLEVVALEELHRVRATTGSARRAASATERATSASPWRDRALQLDVIAPREQLGPAARQALAASVLPAPAPGRRRPPRRPKGRSGRRSPLRATRERALRAPGTGCAASRATGGRTGAGSPHARRRGAACARACRGRRDSAASSRRR